MDLSISGIYDRILYQMSRLPGTQTGNRLMILMYHGTVRKPLDLYNWCFIDETLFRGHIEYLKKQFEVVPLLEGVERLKNGKINRPAAVVTFDDGFQNNYDVAFPVLRRAGVPATIFLTTALVDTTDTLWPYRLHLTLTGTKRTSLEWGGQRFDLSGTGAVVKAAKTIKNRLKELPHPRLLAELRAIIVKLGDDPDRPVLPDSPFRMLGRREIEEMAASGLIEFGAHTHSHAILSSLSPKERYDEIERSVNAVQELTGRPCESFAYPFGRAGDYDQEIIKILKSLGIRAAVTAIEGANDNMTPLMELRRFGIGADLGTDKFKRKTRLVIAQGVESGFPRWSRIWQR
jgi:peptidoglycan/xylan/chitin deacetylase (PgdA/CDA1 family)